MTAECGQGYQCIVLDPPWENKSAKRGSKYPTLRSRNLLGIPLQQLMHKVNRAAAMSSVCSIRLLLDDGEAGPVPQHTVVQDLAVLVHPTAIPQSNSVWLFSPWHAQ